MLGCIPESLEAYFLDRIVCEGESGLKDAVIALRCSHGKGDSVLGIGESYGWYQGGHASGGNSPADSEQRIGQQTNDARPAEIKSYAISKV